MKIIVVYLITLTSLCLTAQENPFVGTWEYDDGATTFRVIFEEIDNTTIGGDYELINKNTSAIIYESRKDLGHGVILDNSIYGGTIGDLLSANVNDRTINHPEYSVLMGQLVMELLNTSPYQTATWKVKRHPGIRLDRDTREFNIPTDIILTKIEDNPVLDD